MRRLLPLLLLAACADPVTAPIARIGCTGELRLINAASTAVEQAYSGVPGDWGPDLLAPSTLAPGGTATLRGRIPPSGARWTLRAVFVNGQGAELPGLDICTTRDITIRDRSIQADAPR
jgi:hypothetical protein